MIILLKLKMKLKMVKQYKNCKKILNNQMKNNYCKKIQKCFIKKLKMNIKIKNKKIQFKRVNKKNYINLIIMNSQISLVYN